MKLFFLGILLIILISVIIKYLQIKDKEKSKEGLTQEQENKIKITADEKQKLLNKQKTITWKKREIGILGIQPTISATTTAKVSKNEKGPKGLKLTPAKSKLTQKVTKTDRKQTSCSAMTSCNDLTPDSGCGFCHSTGRFSAGTKKGPSADVCLPMKGKNMWTFEDAKACKKVKKRTMCTKLNGCDEIYGDAEGVCGYCPTTGEVMAYKTQDGKLVPEYPDDQCNYSGGLLTGKQCHSFLKNNPCITPYHESGPQSAACLKKLWKKSGCTNEYVMGNKNMNELKEWEAGYKYIGAKMKEIFEKTKSGDLNTALNSNKICYNNTDRVKVCDQKFKRNGLHPKECYEKKYLESGCSKNGWGWTKIIQKNLIDQVVQNKSPELQKIYGKNIDNDNYSDRLKKIKDVALKGPDNNAELYAIKKRNANECYGKEPPQPPAIKKGDSVEIKRGMTTWKGIVVEDKDSNKTGVMWLKIYKNDKLNKDRKTMINNNAEQKKYFGWPGIPPVKSGYRIGNNNYYAKSSLTVIDRCVKDDTPQCKITCGDIVRDLYVKYPRPRDCIVSDWGNWGKCNRKCGGGIQYKKRTIKYQAKYGGTPCPELTKTKRCNVKPCWDTDFKEVKTTPYKVKWMREGFQEGFKEGWECAGWERKKYNGSNDNRGIHAEKLKNCYNACKNVSWAKGFVMYPYKTHNPGGHGRCFCEPQESSRCRKIRSGYERYDFT